MKSHTITLPGINDLGATLMDKGDALNEYKKFFVFVKKGDIAPKKTHLAEVCFEKGKEPTVAFSRWRNTVVTVTMRNPDGSENEYVRSQQDEKSISFMSKWTPHKAKQWALEVLNSENAKLEI